MSNLSVIEQLSHRVQQQLSDARSVRDVRALAMIARVQTERVETEPPHEEPMTDDEALRYFWAVLGCRHADVDASLEDAERGEEPPADAISSIPNACLIEALRDVRNAYAARDRLREQHVRRAAAMLALARMQRERLAA